MARPVRRASAFATTALAAFAIAVTAFMPVALAQDGAIEDIEDVDYAFSIFEQVDDTGTFAWTPSQLQVPAGSNVVLIYNSAGATAQHNIDVTEGATATPQRTEILEPDSGKNHLTFTMPEEGTVTFVCDIHPEMVGTLSVGPFESGGGAGAAHITEAGVHFLAHWVGVIAFAALFIIYGLAFFLFKYNETPFATDHMDRATPAGAGGGAEHGEPFLTAKNTVWVLVFLLVLVVGIIMYLLNTGRFA